MARDLDRRLARLERAMGDDIAEPLAKLREVILGALSPFPGLRQAAAAAWERAGAQDHHAHMAAIVAVIGDDHQARAAVCAALRAGAAAPNGDGS
jgi:hypothetical protein